VERPVVVERPVIVEKRRLFVERPVHYGYGYGRPYGNWYHRKHFGDDYGKHFDDEGRDFGHRGYRPY
jgi:hypothetical protein